VPPNGPGGRALALPTLRGMVRRLTVEQVNALSALIESVSAGWAELRTIDPVSDRDDWVRLRQKLAEWEEEIESIWPARAEPL
jgi:hypothetical protein